MGKSAIARWASKLAAAPSWVASRLGAWIWLRHCDLVGSRCRTFRRPRVENRGTMRIGSLVRLNSHWAPVQLVVSDGGVLSIGNDVFVNFGTMISARRSVVIGSNVMIGNNCIVADSEIAGIDSHLTEPWGDVRPVEIGDRVWLAARVTVLPGTRIGAGSVVAAGSIVSGDVPPGSVVAGIPARVIRTAG